MSLTEEISMPKNNNVYLLVGPRGSGKSTYCEKLVANQPELSIVSRDAIMVRHFGSAETSSYVNPSEFIGPCMQRLIRRKISLGKDLKLLLDAWTGDSTDRKTVISTLRWYGANRVTVLYLVTPVELVKKLFWKKPGIAQMSEIRRRQGEGLTFYSEDVPERDYANFHKHAINIDSDGFDQVIRVNPLEPLIFIT